MFKLLVLTQNVKAPIHDDWEKVKDYVKRYHNFELDVEFKEVNTGEIHHLFTKHSGGQFWYNVMGLHDRVKPFVEEDKYHGVFFHYDTNDTVIGKLQGKGGHYPTSVTYRLPLYTHTELAEVITNETNDKADWIYKSIVHELYHMFINRANRHRESNESVIEDVMDNTPVNGTYIPYYKNDEPEASDGNFALQRARLEGRDDDILEMKKEQAKNPTYSENFEKAFIEILKWEGGYANDPRDPGGETNYGISKRAYPQVDIKNLTEKQAKSIYYKDYWLTVKGDELDYPVALNLFDCAVNQGRSTAIRLMQEAGDTKADGIIGPKSLEAFKKKDTLKEFLKLRLLRYANTANFDRFGKGWINRAVDIYHTSLDIN